MLTLMLEVPFAACRSFTAGWYRPTATFLTPSAAYGLMLNVAGIESRIREEDAEHDGKVPTTLARSDQPSALLALGIPSDDDGTHSPPNVQSVYQQLHNYPVGKDAGMSAELSRGTKNNISPVRREFLSNLNVTVVLDGNPELEDRIRRGLKGELNDLRYGLPFVGDNQFLPDRLDVVISAPRTYWYARLGVDSQAGVRPNTARLTVWIDRADMSKTVSHLYAPTEKPSNEPPERAWTRVGPPAQES